MSTGRARSAEGMRVARVTYETEDDQRGPEHQRAGEAADVCFPGRGEGRERRVDLVAERVPGEGVEVALEDGRLRPGDGHVARVARPRLARNVDASRAHHGIPFGLFNERCCSLAVCFLPPAEVV